MTETAGSLPRQGNQESVTFTRRRLLRAGGVLTATMAIGGSAGSTSFASQRRGVEVENLGPGVVSHPIMSGCLVDETLYVGSRNLDPTRVAGFHVPTGRTTSTFMMGNGNVVEGVAADGEGGLYAGVTDAANEVNLYRCDLASGEVTEAAAIPQLFIRDVAVAPDGVVYVAGDPRPSSNSHLYSYNPGTGEVVDLGKPEPTADQGSRLVATESTVYYGCNSPRSANEGRGLYAIDRRTGEVNYLRDGFAGVVVLGDILVAGGPAAVLDLNSGEWRDIGVSGDAFARTGNVLIICDSGGLVHKLDLDTWQITELGTVGFGNSWSILGVVDQLVVGAVAEGLVWTFDLETGQSEGYELVSAGAEGGAELAMSVAAGGGLVYVAGNRTVALHDPAGESVENLPLPGEAKDMTVVDDVAYMCVYNGHGLWEHRPGGPPRQVAELPPEQNRPEAVCWDAVNGLVAVGVRSDTTEGGSVCFYDPLTESIAVHVDPLGGSQGVRTVVAAHGLVYLGGERSPRLTGDVAAWDPVAGREVWRLEAPLGEDGISNLVVIGQRLFGVTLRGPRFFVIDMAGTTPQVVHVSDISSVSAENPALVVDRGWIYGAAAGRPERSGSLFRIHPTGDYRAELLVDDLNGEWFGIKNLAVDEGNNLYTLAGRDLVRIRDRTPPRRREPE